MKNFKDFAWRRLGAGRALLAIAVAALACPRANAAAELTSGPDDMFATTATPKNATTAGAEGNVPRLFVTDKFVFALEQYTHRIAVHDRATGDVLFYYGATAANGAGAKYTDPSLWKLGSGNGAFNQPFGLALDTFSGENRFAVADTGNNRVQLFKFNPSTGAITFVSAYGSASPAPGLSAPEGTFSKPRAVAFTEGGDLLVADTGNYRAVRLSYSSGSWTWGESYQFTEKDIIYGICYDKDTADGFWVANYGNERQRVSFHHMEGFSDEPSAFLGAQGSGDFSRPHDVQVWKVGSEVRIVAADYNGSRVRILKPRTGGSGAYTGLTAAGDVGTYRDPAIEEYQWLFHPAGVFPIDGEDTLYVADYGHDMVKWYGVTITEDEDPIDEEYETVAWQIDSFTVAADGTALATVGWTVPDANLPADTAEPLTFVLRYRPSLTDGDWSDTAIGDNPFSIDQAKAGEAFEAEIDLSAAPLSASQSGFFTLQWTNKVAE